MSAAEELRREVPNCETRLIRDFKADQTWELSQGDVLYLPPRIPHQGAGQGDAFLDYLSRLVVIIVDAIVSKIFAIVSKYLFYDISIECDVYLKV